MENLKKEGDLKTFDPNSYMHNYVVSEEAANNLKPEIEILHRLFNSHKLSGKRLLDVGTGPTVHTLITACNHVDEIYLSEFLPQNLQYLENWRNGEENQCTSLIDYAMELEGRTKTVSQRMSDLRCKVKGILPVDVTSSKPIGDAFGDEKLDIIVSSYCIETAVFTVEGYGKCIENISTLLNKDGFLILFACLNGDTYQVGECKYKAVCLTKDDILSCLRKAGFVVIATEELAETDYDSKYLTFDSYYYILARKLM
ncbi:nicotinamide N-methyltransferase-like [Argopecten irradians]|uniref:nicotinamide N-methyltransferase-like n=1 Tax=Argopecten irradians TaxID=31199 RepID=UPI00371CA426